MSATTPSKIAVRWSGQATKATQRFTSPGGDVATALIIHAHEPTYMVREVPHSAGSAQPILVLPSLLRHGGRRHPKLSNDQYYQDLYRATADESDL